MVFMEAINTFWGTVPPLKTQGSWADQRVSVLEKGGIYRTVLITPPTLREKSSSAELLVSDRKGYGPFNGCAGVCVRKFTEMALPNILEFLHTCPIIFPSHTFHPQSNHTLVCPWYTTCQCPANSQGIGQQSASAQAAS